MRIINCGKCASNIATNGGAGIPDLGDVPMEASILAHVHPLGPSFRPGGGQALPCTSYIFLEYDTLIKIWPVKLRGFSSGPLAM